MKKTTKQGTYTKKAQTATEYIIILAVVIVIALVVASMLGGFPGIGSEVSTKGDNAKLVTGNLAITKHVVGNDSSKVVIQNNNPQTVRVTNVTLDGVECESSQLPKTLRVGDSSQITCSNINGTAGERYSKDVVLTYVDIGTNSNYNVTLGTMSGKVAGVIESSSGSSGGSLSAMTMTPNALVLSGDAVSATSGGVKIVMDLSVANE